MIVSYQPLGGAPTTDSIELYQQISDTHPAYYMLRCLCLRSGGWVLRSDLIWTGNFHVKGQIGGPAAFEFWLLQLNVDLPKLGWIIRERGAQLTKEYRLERL